MDLLSSTLASVIEHLEGVIVVDTGSTSDGGYPRFWHLYHRRGVDLQIAPQNNLGSQLHALSIEAHDATSYLPGDASYTLKAPLAGQPDGVGPQKDQALATFARIWAFADQRGLVYIQNHGPEEVRHDTSSLGGAVIALINWATRCWSAGVTGLNTTS